MNDELLNAILLASNKATKAPWTSCFEGRDHTSGSSFIMTGSNTPSDANRDYDIECSQIRIEDQDFIALARNVVPQLVEEIFKLRKILKDNSIEIG